jgi:ribosomal protein S6E (S10)
VLGSSFSAVWWAPNSSPDSPHSWFGNVVFHLPLWGTEGIVRRPGDWHYYWIEMIDCHSSRSASRIFVSSEANLHQTYPALFQQYDPYVRGGPWFIDKHNQHWYLLQTRQGVDGHGKPMRQHTLEFLRDAQTVMRQVYRISFTDHNAGGKYNCKTRGANCTEEMTQLQAVCVLACAVDDPEWTINKITPNAIATHELSC